MIAICPNPYRDIDLELTSKAVSILESEGFECVVLPVFSGSSGEKSLKDFRDELSLAIIIGGDGTILSVAGDAHEIDVPLLGVNLGTKGFMASIEPENIDLIRKAAKGEYKISRRMMLDVFLQRNESDEYIGSALNDAVIHGYGECVEISVRCCGEKITAFSGDGVVFATPTGSTGYSMSAGGPIVEPEAQSIIVSPICAHAMGSRSFVLDSHRTVSAKATIVYGRKAYLSVDGSSGINLQNGDEIVVKRSERCISMVDLGVKSFYETAFEKLY